MALQMRSRDIPSFQCSLEVLAMQRRPKVDRLSYCVHAGRRSGGRQAVFAPSYSPHTGLSCSRGAPQGPIRRPGHDTRLPQVTRGVFESRNAKHCVCTEHARRAVPLVWTHGAEEGGNAGSAYTGADDIMGAPATFSGFLELWGCGRASFVRQYGTKSLCLAAPRTQSGRCPPRR